METDIAKYAMWLFDRTVTPCEQLPELYDQLCHKNPVRSESFSFQDFEALYHQWRWQRLTQTEESGDYGSFDADSGQTTLAACITETTQMLSPDAAPMGDYHVVTEMLIEQLIAAVRQHLADGWIPLGGVSRTGSGSGVSYWVQALVKPRVN